MVKFNHQPPLNGLPMVIIQIMLIFTAVKGEIVKWGILLPNSGKCYPTISEIFRYYSHEGNKYLHP